jgi:hypothetical protein
MLGKNLRTRVHFSFMVWGMISLVSLLIFKSEDIYASIVSNYFNIPLVHVLQNTNAKMPLFGDVYRVAQALPYNTKINRLAGQYAFLNGDNNLATYYLCRTSNITIADRVIAYWLAKTFERLEDYTNALVFSYEAGQFDYFPVIPPDFPVHKLENIAYDLRGKTVSAYAAFELAKRIYDANPALGRYYFDVAVKEKPLDLHYSLDAAWFLYEKEDWQAAREFGKYTQQQFPDEAWSYVFLGELERVSGNFPTAIQYLETSLALNPSPDAAYTADIALAKIYNASGVYDVALSYLQHAESVATDLFPVYVQRALAYIGMGACDEAEGQLTKIADLPLDDVQQQNLAYYIRVFKQQCP